MSNLDDQTLEILAGLNAAQPLTQQVDYSGFMRNFQPVLNDPNLFVPQQGLLQNTPVLDTLSDLDVMQQRPPVVMDMLNQYPTLERDFQRSFAVSPDTFNMNVYQPLPYNAALYQGLVNQGGSTSGGIDLTGLGAAGLLGAGAVSLLGGGDDGTDGTDGIDSSTSTGSTNTGSIDVGTITTGVSGNNTLTGDTGTNTTEISSNTGGVDNTIGTITGVGSDDTVDDGTGTETTEISTTGNNNLTNTIIGRTGNDTVDSGTSTETIETGTGYITKNDALSIIETLTNNNTITSDEATDLTNTIEKTNANFGTALKSGLGSIVGSSAQATNLINSAETILKGTGTTTLGNTSIPTGVAGSTFKQVGTDGALSLDGSIDASINLGDTGIPNSAMGVDPFGNITFNNDKGIFIQNADGSFAQQTTDKFGNITYIDIDGDPRGLFDRIETGISDFLTNPINEGFGAAGSALNDATQLTGAETLSLIGAGLSGLDAIEEGNISNVYNTGAGLGASGLLGGTAQALATSPAAIALGTILAIAQGLAPPSSGKTGSGAYDYNTSTNTEFGMAGDKFKQGHVDTASAISQGIGQAVNTIAEGYGLNVEGDHLVEFGRERPLNVTFGDTDEEQTNTNRLNYSPETGDILNTNEDITRLYYTGAEGNDGSALASNVIRGTNLLSLKAIANDEDTINMKDFKVPALSENDAKNRYLSMGLDENAANMLTSTSQQANTETISLLGSLIIPNTTNEDLFLTDAEKTSLLDKGYTEEQLNQILYG